MRSSFSRLVVGALLVGGLSVGAGGAAAADVAAEQAEETAVAPTEVAGAVDDRAAGMHEEAPALAGLAGLEALDVPGLIVDAAVRWHLPPERLLRVAWCESRWQPWAYGAGGHMGVFQFSARTWAWASGSAGYAGASPYDAVANVESAAWLMATDGFGHWGCR